MKSLITQNLVIQGVFIRMDDAGRFCLNDLHKASGGEQKSQPALFIRRLETQDLINEINSTDSQSLAVMSVNGRNGGTYACKELVYAYAMWISPKFHLQVIRSYDALAANPAQQLTLPNFNDPVEAARAWANEVEQKQIAIKTKAEIGSRREATAMNTAAQAVKRLRKLERERDRERIYCTIRRATVLFPGRRFDWRVLKSASAGMEQPPIDVHDELYGTVKSYHADVWLACYGLDVIQGGGHE